jgi:hypothetical protein
MTKPDPRPQAANEAFQAAYARARETKYTLTQDAFRAKLTTNLSVPCQVFFEGDSDYPRLGIKILKPPTLGQIRALARYMGQYAGKFPDKPLLLLNFDYESALMQAYVHCPGGPL